MILNGSRAILLTASAVILISDEVWSHLYVTLAGIPTIIAFFSITLGAQRAYPIPLRIAAIGLGVFWLYSAYRVGITQPGIYKWESDMASPPADLTLRSALTCLMAGIACFGIAKFSDAEISKE